MLILTGLSTPLVGILAVTARTAPSSPISDPVDRNAPIPRPHSFVSRLLRSGEVQDYDRNTRSQSAVQAQLASLPLRRRDRRWNGLFSRVGRCLPETTTVCSGREGTGLICSGCSTCCPAAEDGYQCCQQGFKCCTTTTAAGACCPDDGSSCVDGVCGTSPGCVQDSRHSDEVTELMVRPRLPNGVVLDTVTVTTTVTSFTASRTTGMIRVS
jgi:hypothetical protein